MKVLFLDIDGVLNSDNWYNYHTESPSMGPLGDLMECIDPRAISMVNRIVDYTNCVLVLISSWRCVHPITLINRALSERGLNCYLFGATPSLGKTRGYEIGAWLDLWPRMPESWAILDDDKDMDPYMDHLVVQTTYGSGLLLEHANRVIDILGSPHIVK
jgi:hypothetical protein